MAFDYNAPAELFIPKYKGLSGQRSGTDYSRFATAAEAIRFAVEEFPAIRKMSAWMHVGDESSIATRFVGYTRAVIIRCTRRVCLIEKLPRHVLS
jgi:hypothetical protein